MNKVRCVIIDDEELARGLIKSYVDKLNYLQLIGCFENPLEALSTLKTENVDLLFLDIQMPEIRGTEFAKTLPDRLKVIFTTAYSEYALEGFELNAIDYLLKPITFERFLKAVSKIEPASSVAADGGSITVKSGYDLHKVALSELIFIESDSEYAIYHTANQGRLMSNQSLKKLEDLLPNDLFIRVHRSYIVNKSRVTALKGRDLYIGEQMIPVSDSYYEKVKQAIF